MSIFFNKNFNLNNNIDNLPAENKTEMSGKISKLPEYISALKEGSVFRGEILDVRNNAVKILLSSNDILNARTDGSTQMNIGDILNFRVENNTGMSMLIKAVTTGNKGGMNMLMSALQSAGAPVNERNLSLVKELIDNGQAIDKNTIKTLISNLNNYSELDINTAVNMFKHNIPITGENVTQFNNYVNHNNKLIESFDKLTDDLFKTVAEFSENNSDDSVIKLFNDILKAVTGDENAEITNYTDNATMTNSDMPKNSDWVQNLTDENAMNLAEGIVKSENSVQYEFNTLKILNEQENMGETDNEKMLDKTLINEKNIFLIDENIKENIKKLVKKHLFIDKDVFNNKDEKIKDELLKYYKDIDNKADRLIKVLEQAGLEKSALHENITNVKSNLNFMNDLNNMALYMQFPVKFAESEAHGELYILNRNKHKNKESDVLTAFLHLDMESLGATDVSIRLEKDKLTTEFSLKDEVSQDIVEEHLPELKKRLDEKGYNTTLSIEELSEKEESVKSPFEQVLLFEEPKQFIKRYTFDVRA